MIELDDTVVEIDLGIEEYAVLRYFSVATIRQLLLFDVDRLGYVEGFDAGTAERISAWQSLLRKYITYDSVHEARPKTRPAPEKPSLHDTIEALPLDSRDIEVLHTAGITTVRRFLTDDIRPFLDSVTVSVNRIAGLEAFRDRLLKTNAVTVLSPGRHDVVQPRPAAVSPVRHVSPGEFLDEPVEMSGMDEKECAFLASRDITTIREFVDARIGDLTASLDSGDASSVRLAAWHRYLTKRLKS